VEMSTVLTFLGSAAVTTCIGLVVQAIVNRRKIGAEATKVITDAASSVVANYRLDNADLRLQVVDLLAKVTRLEGIVDQQEAEQEANAVYRARSRALLIKHGEWDELAVQIIRSVIPPIHLPPPPPLEPKESV
jgi:hypothetical protein